MKLRTRLVAIFMATILLIIGMSIVLVSTEYNNSVQQLDAQLLTLENQAAKVLKQNASAATGKLPAFPSNFYIGTLSQPGQLTTVIGGNEVGIPDVTGLDFGRSGVHYSTVPLEGSSAGQMRIRVLTKDRQTAVLGLPLQSVNQITQQLALNAGLATVAISLLLGTALMWVNKLSIRPIGVVTRVAQRINNGGMDSRVPQLPSSSEAHELATALNLLLDESQRSQQRLRQFVSDAAHELRTPLTVIGGYSQLIANGQVRTETESLDAVARIRSESSRMSRLVNDLLTLATVDSGPTLSKKRVNISKIAETVVGDLRVVESRSQIDIVAPKEIWANVDPDLMTQWFVIVLTNAIEFCPTKPITVSIAIANNCLSLSVRDQGPGVPNEYVATMFDRFVRAERLNPAQSKGGFGLGLSIARAIIDAHSGLIGVRTNSDVREESFTEIWATVPLVV